MPVNDELGTRMKTYYEQVPKTRLVRRMPVAIRIDGKAFHTFTRGFQKPFDEVLGNAMIRTMNYLCKNIQGCVFGYTQSDEITLLLIDYQKLDTSAWFDYEVQKMCSIAASMATMEFNRAFADEVEHWWETVNSLMDRPLTEGEYAAFEKYLKAYTKAMNSGAMKKKLKEHWKFRAEKKHMKMFSEFSRLNSGKMMLYSSNIWMPIH